MYISLQGKIMQDTEFTLSPFSDALMYGAGIFETLKYEGNDICFLAEHLQRFRASAQAVDLDPIFIDSEIETFLREMIGVHGFVRGVLKINLFHDAKEDILMITIRGNHYTPDLYEKGFRLKTSFYRRNERSFLVHVKSDNYLENILEFRKAKKEGFDEVIFLNSKDELAEGSLSNIFFVKDGMLMTPADDCGILCGILRGKVLALAEECGIRTSQGHYRLDELLSADEIFITNSVMEIMPISCIDDSLRKPGKITDVLMKEYAKNYGTSSMDCN